MFIKSGNIICINTDAIDFAVSAMGRPGESLIAEAKENNTLLNVCGKDKRNSVIVMKNGKVLVSSITLEELCRKENI